MRGNIIMATAGTIGAVLSALFGGWSLALQTLLIFMGVDYITGLLVAGVFGKSPKSGQGTLESYACWKGLVRKGVTLLIVLVGARLDAVMGTGMIRDGVIIAFLLNESLSIIENAGLMGVPIPAPIIKALDLLKDKNQKEENM